MNNRRGSTLVWVLAGAAITALGLMAFITSQKQLARTEARLRDEIEAQTVASELVEFFRAMTGVEVGTFLNTNPVNAANPPYPLCAHVNLIDRQESPDTPNAPILLNRHPMMDLGIGQLPTSNSSKLLPNRFFLAQVVDVTTMNVIDSRCGLTNYAYNVGANPNERFFITVGVSWIPTGGSVEDAQRTVLSTLIPE